MQQPVVRDTCPAAAGAYLADIQVMTVAFGAEADPVEEALLKIVAPGEDVQLPFDVVAKPDIGIAVRGGGIDFGGNPPAGTGDLAQKAETSLVRRSWSDRLRPCRFHGALHRFAGCGCCANAATNCHAPVRCC